METTSFAKSLRNYDSKSNAKQKKTRYNEVTRKSMLNNEEVRLNADKKYVKIAQYSNRQTSAHLNSATSNNRRSLLTNFLVSHETFMDKMSDQRIFDRKFRIENMTRNLFDTKLTAKLQSYRSDSNDEGDESPVFFLSKKKQSTNNDVMFDYKTPDAQKKQLRKQSSFYEKIHLPILDAPMSSKLDLQVASAHTQSNRITSGIANNRLQLQRKQNNLISSNSEESYSCEIVPLEQKKPYVLKLQDQKLSSKSKRSDIFEMKANYLPQSTINKMKSFNLQNSLFERDERNAMVPNENYNDLNGKDLTENNNDTENDSANMIKANQKCTEWLEKHWQPQSSFVNDTEFLEIDNFF
jgi:hypothetical protein